MERTGNVNLGDARGMPTGKGRPTPPFDFRPDAEHLDRPATPETDSPAAGERRGARRLLLISSLVVLMLAAAGSATALARRSDDRDAAALPPPAPLIPAITRTSEAPAGAVGVGPIEGVAPVSTAPSRTPPAASPSATPPATPTAKPPTTPPAAGRSISAPVGGLRAATFELADGTSAIVVRTASTGGDLYRITASPAARQQPRATVRDGVVRLNLTRTGPGGKGEVQVLLNAELRWSLRVSASVSTGVFDMRNSELAAARFAGDAAGIDLRTPRVDGTLPIRITGGINQFRVRTTGAPPARVRIDDGAGKVELDGRTTDGVAPDTSITGRGFGDAEDRIDIDVAGGIGAVTVAPA